VVVREDHRAPVVVSQVWYKVGSATRRRAIPACPTPWNT
jgi:hypothetical protein